MAIDDLDNTSDATDGVPALDHQDVRDLAMREALGILDASESAAFEDLFGRMTPDDQAAVLDLQAAVAREIAGAGEDAPDRSLRYRVLARLTEEMAADPAARGPLAVIGAAASRESLGRGREVRLGDAPIVTELQFDRIRRSAGVWRVASLALGSAVLSLGLLQYQAQNTIGLVVDRLGDQVVTDDIRDLVDPSLDIDRFIDQQTAVAMSLVATTGVEGAGVVLAEPPMTSGSDTRAALLVALKLPEDIQAVKVVAVLPSGKIMALDSFDLRGRTQLVTAALDLSELPDTGFIIEVRDGATGEVLLRSA